MDLSVLCIFFLKLVREDKQGYDFLEKAGLEVGILLDEISNCFGGLSCVEEDKKK